MYVGNLSWSTAWQGLKDHMKQAGEGTLSSCGVMGVMGVMGASSVTAAFANPYLGSPPQQNQ